MQYSNSIKDRKSYTLPKKSNALQNVFTKILNRKSCSDFKVQCEFHKRLMSSIPLICMLLSRPFAIDYKSSSHLSFEIPKRFVHYRIWTYPSKSELDLQALYRFRRRTTFRKELHSLDEINRSLVSCR